MKVFILFLLPLTLQAEENWNLSTGGTAEYTETRYVKENARSKSLLFVRGNNKNFDVFAESRGSRELFSSSYQNKYIYLSAGHRFKPIPGFYILRDKDYYSAFQNPTQGIIPQPINRSAWIGFFPEKWSGGLFMGKDISERKPSIYIKSPEDKFTYTFSPESNVHFLALNLRDLQWKKGKGNPELTINSQGYGKKETYFGYMNFKLLIPSKSWEIEQSNYREVKNGLFAISSDSQVDSEISTAHFFKFARKHYDRIELFQSNAILKRERIAGMNGALLNGKPGAICISGRFYDRYQFKNDFKLDSITAFGVSYEYRYLSTEFMLRFEERSNKDRLGELKFTIRPVPEWKFEISSLVQDDKNQFRSMYEQWSDGENINTILTDRVFAYKLKVIGNFLVFNVSGTRKKFNEGETYFANIQFKMDF